MGKILCILRLLTYVGTIMAKKKSVKSLKAKMDRVHSEYSRRKDTDKNGYGQCCTCGKVLHWKDGDAGHFVPRKHNTTRYHDWNVHLQCRSCNRGGGCTAAYSRFIVNKYGKEALDLLSQ